MGEGQKNSSDIDLAPFCYRDDDRPYLQQPCSLGEHTFATNGHILIRVPRQADVPEPCGAPETFPKRLSELSKMINEAVFSSATIVLPERRPETDDECSACDGTGREHDECPDCKCPCDACDGSGKAPASVAVNGLPVDLKYVARIAALSNLVEFALPPPSFGEHSPAVFRFSTGACVLLMPLRRPHETDLGECLQQAA